jgi:hypothetical protein
MTERTENIKTKRTTLKYTNHAADKKNTETKHSHKFLLPLGRLQKNQSEDTDSGYHRPDFEFSGY